jgi:hypothetical protein
MNNREIALKLVLDSLEIPSSIRTFDDRKRVQKAVYLAQRVGIPLGYRFGWYIKGPYCSDLTSDYYSLARALAAGHKDHVGKKLKKGVQEKLNKIRPLLVEPDWFSGPQEDWLELVASLDYLVSMCDYQSDRARAVFQKEKPQLEPYFTKALGTLKQVGF